ncbi:methyltransferase type 11 [Candidatus Woesearchaeota archaeon CG10_big_fil_rev_8_21_14_0_10_30_7]|nr:MAG: methyltransferase type 11 [Candidatus Woesearchaeota archaeon CG10_big_fil_rev_8_21_14_0_10_30_7]
MKGIVYSLSGKLYDWLDERYETTRYSSIRKKMLFSLEGRILDAGCGTGRNFPYYSKNASVIGVDFSQKMLDSAKERINKSKANIVLKNESLTKLSFSDNYFDNIVATFVLCVMPEKNERSALKELVRVAKPGAELYFLEYVYSKNWLRKTIMFLTAFIPKFLYGLRFNSTLPVIESEKSLKIERTEFVYDDVIRVIVAKKK